MVLPARAAFDSSFWQFTLGIDGYYSSNPDYAGTGGKGSVYGNYRPRFALRPDVAFGTFTADAGASIFTFADDRHPDKAFADTGAEAQIRIGRRARFTISDRFTFQAIEFGKPADTPANLTQVNNAGAAFEYTLPMAGRNQLILGLNFNSTTLLDLTSDYYDYGASLSLTRRMSGRLQVSLNQTFAQTRFYDGGTALAPLNTLSTLGSTVSISYRTGPRLETHLIGGLSIVRVVGTTSFAPTARGGFNWTPNDRLNVRSDLAYSEKIDSRGTAIRLLSAGIGTSYRFTPKFTWETSGNYSRAIQLVLPAGAGGDPESASLNGGTTLLYTIRKQVQFRTGYNYSRGFEAYDYEAHSVTAGLLITL